MALVVDALVGLKWVLQEPDSYVAEALVRIEPDLLVTDTYALQRPPALLILATRPMALHLMTERRDGAVADLRRAGASLIQQKGKVWPSRPRHKKKSSNA